MKIKRYLLVIFSTLAFIGVNSQTLPNPLPSPIQAGAYVPGIISPRDYANPGFSGLAVMDYNIYFNAGNFIDRYGDPVSSIDLVPDPAGISIPVETDVSGYINAPVIAYVSPEIKALGAEESHP